jgi:hypothetical protein
MAFQEMAGIAKIAPQGRMEITGAGS